MARDLFSAEKGFRIYAENSQSSFVDFLFGSGVPGGDTGAQDAAPVGSLYLRTDGTLYSKIGTANSTADWLLNGSSSAVIGKWRAENVDVVTNDTVSVGTRDIAVNPFADDDGAIGAADLTVGHYVIADADGTPVLLKITAISGDDVTFAAAETALVAEDSFITKYFLPDPASLENRALVNYNGTTIVKLSDVDWSFATGINLSSGYSASSGNVTAGDSVEAAIQKLDGVNDAQDTLLGTSQGATDLGTFTGSTIADNVAVKPALQALETAVETKASTTVVNEIDQNVDDLISLSGVAENSSNFGAFTGDSLADNQTAKQLYQRIETLLEQMRGVQVAGITTAAQVDSVPVASVKAVKWLVEVFEVATPANRQAFEVYALNNGTLVDDTVYSKLKLGSNFNLTISVDIDSGNMRLMAASTSGGVTVTARRIEVVKSVL